MLLQTLARVLFPRQALAKEQFGAISGTRDSDLYTARLPGAPTTNYGFGSASKRLISASDKSIGIGQGFQHRITATGAMRRPKDGFSSLAGRIEGTGGGNPLQAPYQYGGERSAARDAAAAHAKSEAFARSARKGYTFSRDWGGHGARRRRKAVRRFEHPTKLAQRIAECVGAKDRT